MDAENIYFALCESDYTFINGKRFQSCEIKEDVTIIKIEKEEIILKNDTLKYDEKNGIISNEEYTIVIKENDYGNYGTVFGREVW